MADENDEELRKKAFGDSLPKYRLFILGSGFSKPAGLPLGNELLELVRSRVKQDFRKYDWDGPLEQEIKEWRKLYPDTELALESVIAFSHRKHFLNLIGSEEYFSHSSRAIAAVTPVIQEILSKQIDSNYVELYERFCKNLTPRDVVLTFNYDTILEDVLESLNIEYSLTPEWWIEKEYKQYNHGIDEPRYVNLHKLHGSIDWYDRYYYDDTRTYYKSTGLSVPDRDPLFGPNSSIPLEGLNRHLVHEGYGDELLSRVFRVKNHRKHFPIKSDSYPVVPFLLPPAYDKILGHDPVRALWRDMHRHQDVFSTITIIGYSMPSYDGYAYEALGKLILDYQSGGEKNYWEQVRTPLQIVTMVDSEKDVLSSIPFLSADKTRIWTEGFSNAALDWIEW